MKANSKLLKKLQDELRAVELKLMNDEQCKRQRGFSSNYGRGATNTDSGMMPKRDKDQLIRQRKNLIASIAAMEIEMRNSRS